MKKILFTTVVVVALVGAGLFAFRGPLLSVGADLLTADMFVSADAAEFDPGLALGERFPAVAAVHDQRVVTDVAEFLGPNGLVVFANRSVVW
ncbi:MAG: hypothetical protein ACNA7W_15490 [Pseudomonadales bacterium]